MRPSTTAVIQQFVAERIGRAISLPHAESILEGVEGYILSRARPPEAPTPPYVLGPKLYEISNIRKRILGSTESGKLQVRVHIVNDNWLGREVEVEGEHRSWIFLRRTMWTAPVEPQGPSELIEVFDFADARRPRANYSIGAFALPIPRSARLRKGKWLRDSRQSWMCEEVPFLPGPSEPGESIPSEEAYWMKLFFEGDEEVSACFADEQWVLWTSWVKWVVGFMPPETWAGQ